MTLSIEICEGEPDSVMPLGANVVQLFAGFEGPPQLSEPHDAEPDGLGAAAAGVGAPLHTKLFQHSLEQSWDPGRCNQQHTSFAKVARVLSLGTLHTASIRCYSLVVGSLSQIGSIICFQARGLL